MVYKSLHGLAPGYLYSGFAIQETAYNLRESENTLCIPLPRAYYFKKNFSCSGASVWPLICCCPLETDIHFNTFKWSRCGYSVVDFNTLFGFVVSKERLLITVVVKFYDNDKCSSFKF